eukprot:657503-Pyramimonas_sp.AAC.1
MRLALFSVRAGPVRGALRKLWADGLLCPDRSVDLGIGVSRECPYCGAPKGTLSHQWNVCPATLQLSAACPEVIPEDVVEFRAS